MTTLSIRKFNGEIPRLPADRMPEDAAPSAPVIFDKRIGQQATYTVAHTPTAGQQALQGIHRAIFGAPSQ